jgi:hypothetical protein
MEQAKLAIDLERKSKISLELGVDQTRELVLLMAQAIVAVHLGAREGERGDARQEDDDVDDE